MRKSFSLRACVLASLTWTCSINSLAEATSATSGLRTRQQDQRNLQQCPPGSWGGCNDASDGPACFSAHATVSVLGRQEGTATAVAMQDLQIGDKILTGKGTYGTVYTFGHANVDTPTQFVQIHVVRRKGPLEMTPEHLVFLYGQPHPVRADTVQAGDLLQAENFSKATVRKVSNITKKGFYAPFTKEGTIVVNGIVSSQYAAFQNHHSKIGQQTAIEIMGMDTGISQHTLGHLAFSPLRLMCLGISSAFCEFDDKNDGTTHSHVAFGIKVYDWAHGSSSTSKETMLLRQSVVLLLGLLLVAPCFLLESCFGAEWAPSMALLAAIVSMYVWGKWKHIVEGIRANSKEGKTKVA